MFDIGVPESTLAQLVSEVCRAPHVGDSLDALARLILPPEGLPPEATRLLVVADGPLHYLPFELLRDHVSEGALLDRLSIGYSPSLSTHSTISSRPFRTTWPNGDFVGFGDPTFDRTARVPLAPLSGSRPEISSIGRIFERSTPYLGADATKERALEGTAGYRYVHFATHALLDDSDGLGSALAFSDANVETGVGLLRAFEMFRLDLDAELIVCSACSTALGQVTPGEGMVAPIGAREERASPSLLRSEPRRGAPIAAGAGQTPTRPRPGGRFSTDRSKASCPGFWF